jgi:peptidoglycan/LPS O-acetylase OafA/YrhL
MLTYDRKYWIHIDLMLIASIYVIQDYGIFEYLGMVDFELVNGHLFGTRFVVFYFGSLLATFYYQFKQIKFLTEYTEDNTSFKYKIGSITAVLYFIGMIIWSARFNLLIWFDICTFLSGLYWTIVIALMLIGAPNFFTNLFNFKYLKYGGKFSFGIYLLHSMCVYYVEEIFHNKLKRYSWEIVICIVISSYICGFLFFYLIENLLMKLSNHLINWISKLEYFRKEKKTFDNLTSNA